MGRRTPRTVNALEELGRVRLSSSFFFRDFLYSDIAAIYGLPNIPDDPDLAIEAGSHLCEQLLEPLQTAFGRIAIRSAYRSAAVNERGNAEGHNCASNDKNFAGHIWDRRDCDGNMGATACIVVPRFWNAFHEPGDWQMLAWWIHDHLPYSEMEFFPKLWAFNLTWNEKPKRRISSYAEPKGWLRRESSAENNERHDTVWSKLNRLRLDHPAV